MFPAAALVGIGLANLWTSPAAGFSLSNGPTAGIRSVRNVAVFGDDERIAVVHAQSRLRGSIGLVYNNRSRQVCTAFCVGDTLVATAAHCLFRTAGKARPALRNYRFILYGLSGRPNARIAGHRLASPDQFVLAGSLKPRTSPPIDAARDWALMKLDRSICRKRALRVRPLTPSAVEFLAADGKLINIAFHKDFGQWTLASSRPCTARSADSLAERATIARDFAEPDHLLLHTCDTGGASSGSPLLIVEPTGNFTVVGLNVGTYVVSRMLLKNGRVVRRYKASPIANTAVAATAFADEVAWFRSADILGSRRKLRVLQTTLRGLGLYAGGLDGAFGPVLRRAIGAYERQSGQRVRGLPTETLLSGFRGATTKSQPAQPVPTNEVTLPERRVDRGTINYRVSSSGVSSLRIDLPPRRPFRR